MNEIHTNTRINDEIKRLDFAIKRLKIDRDKSDKIRGLTYGLSSYMALANIIDINSMTSSQLLIRNLILFTSTILYIRYKRIGDYNDYKISVLTKFKEKAKRNKRLYKKRNK